jgi:hypothetical protein
MKKSALLLILLLISFSFVLAEDEEIVLEEDEDVTDESQVSDAYDCLRDKIDDKDCDKLSINEKIFALMAVGKCKDEVKDDSSSNECWPEGGCEIKTTAQAILALEKRGGDTDKAVEWLSEQNTTPSDVVWYLQIDSNKQTTCSVGYNEKSYSVTIGEDKKLNGNAGSCLSLAEEGYWLRVSSGCYDQEFEVSCDEDFITNLMYKKKLSSTIYVSEKTNSGSAQGTTTEKINSLCFSTGSECDYEGSLWAALTLNYVDEDVSSYLPYLIAMADGNDKYLPESFLYILDGSTDFRSEVLQKQMSNKYWDVSGNKFYDTALALYGFSEGVTEKTNSIKWLLEVQDKDGCWGSIVDTSFILHSIWPRGVSPVDEGDDDCDDSGFWCMSGIDCEGAGGEVLDYSCSGVFKCCNKQKQLETCDEMNGAICDSGDVCDESTLEAADTFECCLGRCDERVVEEETVCEENNGACRSSCFNDEKENNDECGSGDVCCVEKGGSYMWIWILLILILIIIAGIVFKDKLRPFWFQLKSKFGKDKSSGKSAPNRRGPGLPGMPSARIPQRGMPRRVLPPSPRRAPPRTKGPGVPGEMDNVLNKLKEMGK